MPPEKKRIVLAREASSQDTGSPVGIMIFCAVTMALFVYTMMARGRDLLFPRLMTGLLALAGLAGVVFKLLSDTSYAAYGATPLEVEGTPSVGGELRATLQLPPGAADISHVHAELLCNSLHRNHKEWDTDLVWGKGANFVVRRRATGGGEVVLVFAIPAGLPHAEKLDPQARASRNFGSWVLRITAETSGPTFDRSYDLDIQPGAALPAGAPPVIAPVPMGTLLDTGMDGSIPLARGDGTSAWALVAANLVLIAGVALWGWRVEELVFLYWIENLVIGAFNVPRILMAVPSNLGRFQSQGIAPTPTGLFIGKLALAAFFVLHFGFFCYAHGEALTVVFLNGHDLRGAHTLGSALLALLADPRALAAIGVLVGYQAYSFVHDYIGGGEYESVDTGELMRRPYQRILATHLFLGAGGFALFYYGSTLALNIGFVVVKIALDVAGQFAERRARSSRQS